MSLSEFTPKTVAAYKTRIYSALKSQQDFDCEFRISSQWSIEKYIRQETYFERDNAGELVRVVGTFQDVSDNRAAQERIKQLAFYDSVTGLPNRSYFMERLSETMALASRYNRSMALMFVDLDQFKRVNDTWGHHIGDQLLVQVSQRISDTLRRCDVVSRFDHSENHHLARLGGDEFVVLLSEIEQPEDAAIVARRITAELKKPFPIENTEVHVSASIGISCFPTDGSDESSLLKHADIAMYQVKEQGRDAFRFYESGMNVRTIERLNLENSLRRALERKEFEVRYQPKLSCRDGQLLGAEALVRWRHPELGIISPGDFIEIAEECGLIVPLGHWVLETAIAQIVEWQATLGRDISIAVNTSAVQFSQEGFLDSVKSVVTGSGVAAHLVELEITESLLMESTEKSIELIATLRELGIKIAIDDFGTGYSSMSYLKTLPIDRLKIDRSFVRDMVQDKRDAGIVHATIALSHHLELEVTAEGVETEDQLQLLREYACDDVQGYLFCPPLPADEFIAWVHDYESGEARHDAVA